MSETRGGGKLKNQFLDGEEILKKKEGNKFKEERAKLKKEACIIFKDSKQREVHER